jgi:pilus assembly protein CpaF
MSVRLLEPETDEVVAPTSGYERVKHELHTEVVSELDPAALRHIRRRDLEQQLRARLDRSLRTRDLPLTKAEQDRVVDDVLDEILGYGPIERLLRSSDATDILVNGPDTVYIERNGKLEHTDVHFRDEAHLRHVIDRIVSRVGRRIDESVPMVDARLPDGSRFNAIIPPLALNGPTVSIRRFGLNPIRREDLISLNSVPDAAMRLLEGCIRSKLNVLVSGGTGSGKTTLLNVLSAFIGATERIITIEDAAELRLQQPHVIRLETRPPNLEGAGEITTRDLVRNALRMRPDRIIVGEIRGLEAIDMLQAMNTGHEGSISTIHANSPRHALSRIETMVGLGMGNIPGPAIREMIAEAIDLVIQVSRLSDGKRRLTSITEINGIAGGVISTQEIFRFNQRTVDATGMVRGRFESTGVRPEFTARFSAYGIALPPELLSIAVEV